MITLHHLEYSQSFRVLWLLEELEVDYELVIYQRDPITLLAPAEYKALSPTHTAPVITHGDLVLSETSAIIEYILDLYSDNELRPERLEQSRSRFLFWFHAAQSSVMPLMLMDSVFKIMTKRSPVFLKVLVRAILSKASAGFLEPRMEQLLKISEEDLARAKWFAGDEFSAADIVMSYPIESANMRGYIKDRHQHTKKWLQSVYDRPAFQRAKHKDGKASMVLPL